MGPNVNCVRKIHPITLESLEKAYDEHILSPVQYISFVKAYLKQETEKIYSMQTEKKIVKSCRNCGYRDYSQCTLSGYSCNTERRYPSVCGIFHDNWKPRLSLIERLNKLLSGK